MNKKKGVGGDLFPPSVFSLTLVLFESFFSRVLSLRAFPLYCFSYLLTTRDPEFISTGITSWPAGSQDKRWARIGMPKQRREKMWSSKELISTLRVFMKKSKLVVLARKGIDLLPHRLFCLTRSSAESANSSPPHQEGTYI